MNNALFIYRSAGLEGDDVSHEISQPTVSIMESEEFFEAEPTDQHHSTDSSMSIDGDPSATYCDDIPENMFEPLYQDSTITTCGAYFSIMHFANQNKLSYTAINDLLALLQLFCPEPNNIPSSFYRFKKFFKQFSSDYTKKKYCLDCETEFEGSSCSTEDCRGSGEKGYLVQIPIEKSLQAIISSKYNY